MSLQVLLGDMGTGKTSLALRFIKGQFYDKQVTSHFLFVLQLNVIFILPKMSIDGA